MVKVASAGVTAGRAPTHQPHSPLPASTDQRTRRRPPPPLNPSDQACGSTRAHERPLLAPLRSRQPPTHSARPASRRPPVSQRVDGDLPPHAVNPATIAPGSSPSKNGAPATTPPHGRSIPYRHSRTVLLFDTGARTATAHAFNPSRSARRPTTCLRLYRNATNHGPCSCHLSRARSAVGECIATVPIVASTTWP